MFVHAVYFWLREGFTLEQSARFRGGLESLRG
ncbi:MAG: Dabb family protein, partial [Candidatus Hydrogenedentes bacterium]|nr:Dabb family protein [Candidatus Hydrogenedentota bacterium]